MATIDQIIASQSAVIDEAMGRAYTLSGRISNWIPNINVGNVPFNHSVTKPDMAKPAELSDWLPSDDRYGDLMLLDREAEKWIDKFFPELNGCLKQKPEQWLCRILGGEDPFGEAKKNFDIVWSQARDNAYSARNAASDHIRAEFSSRGFTVPPGAMIGALMRANEAAESELAQINREEAKRIIEIKLDLLKFAEDHALRLKQGILQSLADFYRQWSSLPDRGMELAKTKASVYATLQSALREYHGVELGFENLRLRAAEARANIGISNDRNKTAVSVNNEAAPALGQAVRAFGDVAASAATGISSLVADLGGGS